MSQTVTPLSPTLDDKVYIFTRFWQPTDLDREPEALFIFGDNSRGIGKKGQAIIRDKTNAFGIPTQETWQKFYHDRNYVNNIQQIDTAIAKIVAASPNYEKIYFPMAGLGTGLAQLATRAPQTWSYLNDRLLAVFGIINSDNVQLIRSLDRAERMACIGQLFSPEQMRLMLVREPISNQSLKSYRFGLVTKMNRILTRSIFTPVDKVRILEGFIKMSLGV